MCALLLPIWYDIYMILVVYCIICDELVDYLLCNVVHIVCFAMSITIMYFFLILSFTYFLHNFNI